MTVVNGIQIELEDLFLAIIPLQLDGERQLFDLAGHGAVIREEDVFHGLLGDGAAALERLSSEIVRESSARDADEVHRAVLIEAAVFGRDDPLLEVVRDLGKGDEFFSMHARLQCFPEVEHIVHFFLGGEELLRPVDGAFCVRLRRPCFDAALLGL